MQSLIDGARSIGIGISSAQLELFECYYRELVEWNRRVNLTSVVEYEEIQTKHFLDSITIVLASKQFPGGRVVDVGAGPGFPGIPLCIVSPDIELVLVESIGKKAAFLEHIIKMLDLNRASVVNDRAECLGQSVVYREQFDLATCRAVGTLSTVAELTLPLCKVGGILVAQKKGSIREELERSTRAIGVLGGRIDGVKTVDIPHLGRDRFLIRIDKHSPTPSQYPRRPGIPRKRPL
ncbi:MAG: 16S rRNA (guanine(527)-N(7))-methyltransferase RsmG [Chloroflexota bacterium]|nr:16S rRNA (guanine(527)-N(7))-methyltransferase RsmG [Chloroflexota bacterium]